MANEITEEHAVEAAMHFMKTFPGGREILRAVMKRQRWAARRQEQTRVFQQAVHRNSPSLLETDVED